MKKLLTIILSIVLVLAITFPVCAISSIAVKGIKLNKSNISLKVGQTSQLTITFTPANTSQRLLTYVTGNKKIAKIDSEGEITGISAGTTTITVFSPLNAKVLAKCKVTVIAIAEKPVTLHVLSQRVEDKAYYETIVKGYQAKYKNIKVKYDLIPTANYPQVATTRIASDEVDTLVTPSQINDPNTRTTLFLNLKGQPFVKYVYEGNILADFLPGIDKEGDIWGLPIGGTTFLTFYNKTIFKKQGLEVPTTYTELCAVCDKLKAAGITPFLFGGKDQWPVNMIFNDLASKIAQPGNSSAAFYKNLNTEKTKFTDANYVEIFKRMNVLFQKYFDPNSLGLGYSAAPGMFAQGKAAMMIDGNWSSAQINQAKPTDEIGVFATPISDNAAFNKQMIARNGMAWSIIHSSPNKDAALKWLDFIFQPENQKLACDTAGLLPTGPGYGVKDPLSNEIGKLLQSAPVLVSTDEVLPSKYTPGCKFDYTPYLIDMFAGKLTPDQVALKLQTDYIGSKASWKLPQ